MDAFILVNAMLNLEKVATPRNECTPSINERRSKRQADLFQLAAILKLFPPRPKDTCIFFVYTNYNLRLLEGYTYWQPERGGRHITTILEGQFAVHSTLSLQSAPLSER